MKFFNALFLIIPFLFFQTNLQTLNVDISEEVEFLSIDDLEAVADRDDKKILVKLSATWCKPCKQLSQTFKQQEVKSYLSENFHVVDFDIQTKRSVTYKGKTYNYVEDPKMSYHELAMEMMEDRLSIPALLVLDTDLQKVSLTRGGKTEGQLLEFLQAI